MQTTLIKGKFGLFLWAKDGWFSSNIYAENFYLDIIQETKELIFYIDLSSNLISGSRTNAMDDAKYLEENISSLDYIEINNKKVKDKLIQLLKNISNPSDYKIFLHLKINKTHILNINLSSSGTTIRINIK